MATAPRNQFNLPRYIPVSIRREIRQRCKFGCVVCRAGLYEFEHIEPSFENAQSHNPDGICCLCAGCHDRVTRGHLSKAAVMREYRRIWNLPAAEVPSPTGPLDFHAGRANLRIGGLYYPPGVRTVLRYLREDLIRLNPSAGDEPGSISATFTDPTGRPSLWLEESGWIGSTDNWDIEVVGARIKVRPNDGPVALQLRLDPPESIVVERLDMRYGDAYVLAGEENYAVGRIQANGSIVWLSAQTTILSSNEQSMAIELAESAELEARLAWAPPAMKNGLAGFFSAAGAVVVPSLGISIASFCASCRDYGMGMGVADLDGVRNAVFSRPDTVHMYIGTGGQKA